MKQVYKNKEVARFEANKRYSELVENGYCVDKPEHTAKSERYKIKWFNEHNVCHLEEFNYTTLKTIEITPPTEKEAVENSAFKTINGKKKTKDEAHMLAKKEYYKQQNKGMFVKKIEPMSEEHSFKVSYYDELGKLFINWFSYEKPVEEPELKDGDLVILVNNRGHLLARFHFNNRFFTHADFTGNHYYKQPVTLSEGFTVHKKTNYNLFEGAKDNEKR